MQYLVAPFCSVCQEIIVETVHQKSNPILALYPKNQKPLVADSVSRFAATLIKPSPNTLSVKWLLNGEQIAEQVDSIYIQPVQFDVGENIVKLVVEDTTNLVRNPTHSDHVYEQEWIVSSTDKKELSAPITTWGDSLETCFNGDQAISIKNPVAGFTYRWYDQEKGGQALAETTNFQTPRLLENKTYYVEAIYRGNRSPRTAIHVHLLDEIAMPVLKTIEKTEENRWYVTVEQETEDYYFRWVDADGELLPGTKASSMTPGDRSHELLLDEAVQLERVFVQKVHRNSTCYSDVLEIPLQR